jgi:hypothetical protein
MPQPNDLSRSLVALHQNSTIIAIVEMSQSSWLVGGMLPGIERQPCKELEPAQNGCLRCCIAGGMRRSGPGREITRIAFTFEGGEQISRQLAIRAVKTTLSRWRRRCCGRPGERRSLLRTGNLGTSA